MPVTRRRRANPPDQPENTTNHLAEQAQTEQQAEAAPEQPAQEAQASAEAATPTSPAPQTTPTPLVGGNRTDAAVPYPTHTVSGVPLIPPSAPINGNGDRADRQDYGPTIEPGRRTARGEYFRRPPQPPMQPTLPPAASAPLQAPSHEIKLPLGKEPGDTRGDPLHLAYNPGYTGADEARSSLLHRLAEESKTGGRARCWNCGSLAIVYECWNTRSRSFGEVGVAYCEICGVWSVM